MNTDQFVNILTYILIFMIMLLFTLIIVYVVLKLKSNNKKIKEKTPDTVKKDSNNSQKKQSVLNFMEFEKIEDNMIIKNNGKKYIMVLKCQGINYDLMSNMEKISVEEGFLQFLNSLRYPIQLYIQTRTINMTESINNYTKKNYPEEFIYKITKKWENCVPEKIDENILKLLEYLKTKYELVILTDWYEDQQSERLQKIDILKYFQKVYSAENTKRKPFKEAFMQALGDNKPEECIMIGDNFERDIKGALNGAK